MRSLFRNFERGKGGEKKKKRIGGKVRDGRTCNGLIFTPSKITESLRDIHFITAWKLSIKLRHQRGEKF